MSKHYEIEATHCDEERATWRVVEVGSDEQTHWSLYLREDDGFAEWCRDVELAELTELQAFAMRAAARNGQEVFLRNEDGVFEKIVE